MLLLKAAMPNGFADGLIPTVAPCNSLFSRCAARRYSLHAPSAMSANRSCQSCFLMHKRWSLGFPLQAGNQPSHVDTDQTVPLQRGSTGQLKTKRAASAIFIGYPKANTVCVLFACMRMPRLTCKRGSECGPLARRCIRLTSEAKSVRAKGVARKSDEFRKRAQRGNCVRKQGCR